MSRANEVRLGAIRACFEGVIPSIVATVDAEGVPNISYLSQVYYLDEAHVALSNQFFSKTAANVRLRGEATVLVVDGRTGDQYELDLAFLRAETDGPVFARMAAHLRAMSSHQGWGEIMKLRSADIFRLRSCRAVAAPADDEAVEPDAPRERRIEAATTLALALAAEADRHAMLDLALDGLADRLGMPHTMLLVRGEQPDRLVTIASRGYPTGGVGAETAIGQGVPGIAAETRHPLRISDMSRGRRYAAAVSTESPETVREVPMPGLPEPQSQLAVPLLALGRLLGVLFVESAERFAFSHEDEIALLLVAAQLATGLLPQEPEVDPGPPAVRAIAEDMDAPSFRFVHHRFDDSVFIDGTYVIKGVAGRLLVMLLAEHLATGRLDFSNMEIRRARELRLPDLKDNLETRLLLLRRRLSEKAMPVRLLSPARGLVRLELDGRPVIETAE